MTQINWGLQDPNAFARSYGQTKGVFDDFAAAQKKQALDAALRQYATNPNDPNAVNALARVDPMMAIQVRQQQDASAIRATKAKTDQDEAFRDSIKAGGEIIRRIQLENPQMPKEQVYATARQAAIRMRIPGAEQAPPQFDENYYNTLLYAADPEKAEASPYQAVAGQPGAGVYRFDKRTGTMQVLVQPNDGTAPVGAPAQPPPQSGAAPLVTDQASYDAIPPGATYTTPDGNVRVKQGGPAPQTPGGFPDVGHRY